MKDKKGFTLIEMLVVIGIIGLLASVVLVGLTNARKAGRDARRVADLRTIQNALELYFNRCNFYPGGASCSSAGSSSGFTGMAAALTGSSLGIASVPNDPLGGRSYAYFLLGGGQEYVLGAVLEDASNRALQDGLHGGFCQDAYYCVGVLNDPDSIPPAAPPS